MKIHLATLLLLLLSTHFAKASDTQQPSLNEAYKLAYSQFETAYKANDHDATLIYAEQVYELGNKLYGDKHINTAGHAFNYAKMLLVPPKKRFKVAEDKALKAIELLEIVVKIYQSKYGEEAVELIDPLMELGSSHKKYSTKIQKSLNYYTDVLNIAENHKDSMPLLYADLSFEIGGELISSYKGKKKAKRHLQNAYDIYHQQLLPGDRRLANSAFWLAKAQLNLGKYKTTEKLLLEVLDVYEKADQKSHPIEMTTYAILVRVYEKSGQRDKATTYCQAIGKAQPWDENRDQIPIFITEPRWPMSALRRGHEGFVRVTFTIDEQGFVEDPMVADSGGDKNFKLAALKAVKDWRFAPKFENGEAVKAEAAYTMEFILED